MTESEPTPEVSVVIPVYNETAILRDSVTDLCSRLRDLGASFEILLAENGSGDGTFALAQQLSAEFPEVRAFSYPQPNYGGALREGILRARGSLVICEEIDLCDLDFFVRAVSILRQDGIDMVVGSKAMRGALDTRPVLRRTATRVYNELLRRTLDFHGTDTHGLKAFRRDRLLPVVAHCQVEHDVFASELVLRAERAGLRIREIPVAVREKRAPSIDLVRRVPRVLRNLGRLWWALRDDPQHSERQSSRPVR